ncbi:MAG: hypothetical protein P8188_04915 [Gemmatimonadota bacterium]
MKKLTPLLTVDAIEPILPFWTDELGFEVTARVPHPPEADNGPLGFVMLRLADVELMFQTRASVAADLGAGEDARDPGLAEQMSRGLTTLFAQVDSVDDVLEGIRAPRVAVPRRTTFYGMDEIFLYAPGGVLLGLAAPAATEPDA